MKMMDDKNKKKTIIYGIILILLLFGYLGFLAVKNTVFNEKVEELSYYYKLENEESINDLLDENEIVLLKNDIQKYLEELEFTDKEINKIEIKNPKMINKKSFECYILLDDDWQSLYKVSFNTSKKKCNFEWNGDKNNEDYKPNTKGKTYLYIVDKEAYKTKKMNDETKNTLPDEDVEPEGEDVSS